MKLAQLISLAWIGLFTAGMVGWGGVASAAPPVVKTVPWVATNPLIPHDTWSGKQITLKGTADVQGAAIQYTWDFGDGSPVATGTVTNMYAVEALHAYTGAPGTIFTARLSREAGRGSDPHGGGHGYRRDGQRPLLRSDPEPDPRRRGECRHRRGALVPPQDPTSL